VYDIIRLTDVVITVPLIINYPWVVPVIARASVLALDGKEDSANTWTVMSLQGNKPVI
jgi:hypothetical protein